MSKLIDEYAERSEVVNELLIKIGSVGRKFFYNTNTESYDYFEVDVNGRLWFVNPVHPDRTIKTYLHYKWWSINHGETLKKLVGALKDYIRTGDKIPAHHFGPWPEWLCKDDLWGYGNDMGEVRMKAHQLHIIHSIKDSI